MIYFIFGEDYFRVREEAAKLKAAAAKQKIETVSLEGAEIDVAALAEGFTSGSLFTTKRAFFVKNFLLTGDKNQKEVLLEVLPRLPGEVSLIFSEEGVPDKRGKLFSYLKKRAEVKELNPLQSAEVVRFIVSRAKAKGATIGEEAAQQLAAALQNDLSLIESELIKLVLYAQGKTISTQDVEKVVGQAFSAGIFDLLSALGQKSQRAALLLEQLLAQGEDPLYLLSMLAYQVRTLLLVRDLLDRDPKASSYLLARELSLHPFVAQKALAQANFFSMAELVDLHRRLTEADLAIKTGSREAPVTLLLLVQHKARA